MNQSTFTPVYQHVVPFHDCDPLRIVWHGHYYKYLEHAREVFLRARKLDVPDLIELGLYMVVIESRCRYVSPLRHGEHFGVSVAPVDIEQRIHLKYEIRAMENERENKNGEDVSDKSNVGRRIARGWTTFAMMREDEMLMETPLVVQERLRSL